MTHFRKPRSLLTALLFLLLIACDADESTGAEMVDAEVVERDPTPGEPGADCRCDGDCDDIGFYRGICVFGVCMMRAATPIGGERESVECPEGFALESVHEYGGSICVPLCESYPCDGDCDRRGRCRDTEDTDFWCDPTCASYCSDDSVL